MPQCWSSVIKQRINDAMISLYYIDREKEKTIEYSAKPKLKQYFRPYLTLLRGANIDIERLSEGASGGRKIRPRRAARRCSPAIPLPREAAPPWFILASRGRRTGPLGIQWAVYHVNHSINRNRRKIPRRRSQSRKKNCLGKCKTRDSRRHCTRAEGHLALSAGMFCARNASVGHPLANSLKEYIWYHWDNLCLCGWVVLFICVSLSIFIHYWLAITV